MIKIFNNILPLSGYKMMTLWPLLFVRKKAWDNGLIRDKDMIHEEIHGCQQREMLLAGILFATALTTVGCGWWSLFALPMFFYWYGIEWLIRAIIYGDTDTAYRNISFEREAYFNQYDTDYPVSRSPLSFLRYLKM